MAGAKWEMEKKKKQKGKGRGIFSSLSNPPPFSPPSLTRLTPARQATLELGLQLWVSRFARDSPYYREINGGRAKSQLERMEARSIPSRAGNSHARTNHHWFPRETTPEEKSQKYHTDKYHYPDLGSSSDSSYRHFNQSEAHP